ncbi:SHOCT domain-containing protein [Halalkaliarchaeum sp. AArc-GB]|uniref:SHOCT domain-containing protein n=1 Tax=Halalkaliarchaeum sp. AArc-GB TaxID=3074078 RepID=UPI0028621F26|nr:SHOCT domain-containing protein [Halalkaliarchaeum sp. AArc-GB]MDR5674652.1 SHOCT domain-containing protein [Halalkaliarchaeum sp. AArc-GB]
MADFITTVSNRKLLKVGLESFIMSSGVNLEPGHFMLKPCPSCGRDEVYRTKGKDDDDFYYGCDSCGLQLNEDDAVKSPVEAFTNSSSQNEASEIPDEIVKGIAASAVSDLVTPARLHGTEEYFNNVLVYLEQGEQPDYLFPLTRGMFADDSLIVESGAEQTILLDKNSGGTVVVSNRYVRIVSDTGEWTIPYSSISSVDVVGHPALHIHTKGRTYYIKIAGTLFDDEGELNEAASYIRKKQRMVAGDMEAEHQVKKVESEDPIQKIGRLNELKKAGGITEEEFEEKKRQLLDGI